MQFKLKNLIKYAMLVPLVTSVVSCDNKDTSSSPDNSISQEELPSTFESNATLDHPSVVKAVKDYRNNQKIYYKGITEEYEYSNELLLDGKYQEFKEKEYSKVSKIMSFSYKKDDSSKTYDTIYYHNSNYSTKELNGLTVTEDKEYKNVEYIDSSRKYSYNEENLTSTITNPYSNVVADQNYVLDTSSKEYDLFNPYILGQVAVNINGSVITIRQSENKYTTESNPFAGGSNSLELSKIQNLTIDFVFKKTSLSDSYFLSTVRKQSKIYYPFSYFGKAIQEPIAKGISTTNFYVANFEAPEITTKYYPSYQTLSTYFNKGYRLLENLGKNNKGYYTFTSSRSSSIDQTDEFLKIYGNKGFKVKYTYNLYSNPVQLVFTNSGVSSSSYLINKIDNSNFSTIKKITNYDTESYNLLKKDGFTLTLTPKTSSSLSLELTATYDLNFDITNLEIKKLGN